MRFTLTLLTALALAAPAARGAEPVRIGVTTILSGPTADRGQSEQYGIELALSQVNAAGGVLNRPVVAYYGDNAATPATGVAAVHRLVDQVHVPVLIGALATSVSHAIMPIVQQAKIPLVIDISAGQDFVDASGAGGNDYVFKTIPSDLDIARGMVGWMKGQGAKKVAILADDLPFNKANAASFARAAEEAGLAVATNETVPKGTADLAPTLDRLKSLAPDHLILLLGPSTAPFFHAYEQSGWPVPLDGRIDLAAALGAVSPTFLASGGLRDTASVVVFAPLLESQGVRDFVSAYRERYGLTPTQRSFFAYEAALLVVDAIRRANSDQPAAIEAALKTTTMPSALGGSYRMDDHNHPHTPLFLLGVRDGKVAAVVTIGG